MQRPADGTWRKRIAEAVVIVLSILAAFAIDAWWDSATEQRRAAAEVSSLRSEFEAVDQELIRAGNELTKALDATVTLARLAGPNPKPMSADSFGLLLTWSLTVNAVELPTGALANILSSGDLPILNDIELQKNLASWSSIANLMSVKFAYLVTNRDQAVLPLVHWLVALSPALSAAFPKVWTDENHFAFEPTAALSNREFENHGCKAYTSKLPPLPWPTHRNFLAQFKRVSERGGRIDYEITSLRAYELTKL